MSDEVREDVVTGEDQVTEAAAQEAEGPAAEPAGAVPAGQGAEPQPVTPDPEVAPAPEPEAGEAAEPTAAATEPASGGEVEPGAPDGGGEAPAESKGAPAPEEGDSGASPAVEAAPVPAPAPAPQPVPAPRPVRRIRIAHLYPELLNLYGDSGNILVLRRRLEWRGIVCDVNEVHVGDTPSFANADIVFIGGGTDREQRIVCEALLACRNELVSYVEDGGVLGAVCGGYQLLGDSYVMGDERVQGLSLVDLHTERGSPRLIGNVAVQSRISPQPVVGYENHGGRTILGPGVEPMGKVIYGFGNDGKSGYEGCLYKNVVGTYVHGPLLPKNPGVADYLISRALERRYGEGGLEPLDDAQELEANRVMYDRMMAGDVETQ